MKKVILTKGLPASGKTTYAKKMVADNPNSYKIVCKDDLRAMLDAGKWSPDSEKLIIKIRDQIILEALEHGKNVIVADTNLDPKHEAHIRQLVRGKAEVSIQDFTDVPLDTCLKRDALRENSVGKKVITEMYNKYLRPMRMLRSFVPGKESVVICDIDGTLAHMGDRRSPHDYSKVKEDRADKGITSLIRTLAEDYLIVITSGRPESCRKDTKEWLQENNVPHEKLLMRPDGDSRADNIVKEEIYHRDIEPYYNVEYVVDDRLRVCRMWHSLGLTLLRVGDPDADF